ncbi:MAG: hypothetical protein ACRELW_22530 [Candidatus Rokuibacteriota bacterium]
MTRTRRQLMTAPTTAGRRWVALILSAVTLLAACGRPDPAQVKEDAETIARTEFTDRIENFFEYDPLVPGKPSRFLIHLTDLSDGSPVEQAEISVIVHATGGGQPAEIKARAGRVTGIYVAEIAVPRAGAYALEFRVRNAKLDERMSLTGFDTR